MISKAVKVYDLEKAIDEKEWDCVPDYKAADERMYQVALKYRTYEKTDTVGEGSIVTAKLTSGIRKFNRTVRINVGLGLFDRDFEAEIIGKSCGVEYAVVRADEQVHYIVTEAERLVVPEVTDEMSAAEGIEGVKSAKQLYACFCAESLKKSVQDKVFLFMDEYFGTCEFVLSTEELTTLQRRELERCRSVAKGMGLIFDEMTGEQLQGAVGCSSIAEFKKMVDRLDVRLLQGASILCFLDGLDTEEVDVMQANELYYRLFDRVTDMATSRCMAEAGM